MQKFISNNLSDFEFHDALVKNSCIDNNGNLNFEIKHLNIHKNIQQNPHDIDMEIDLTNIVFTDFKLMSYKHGGAKVYNDKGQFLYDDPSYTLTDTNGLKAFEKVLNESFTILYLSDENSIGYIEGCGLDPYFIINFTFSNVTITWEKLADKAWYEKRKIKYPWH